MKPKTVKNALRGIRSIEATRNTLRDIASAFQPAIVIMTVIFILAFVWLAPFSAAKFRLSYIHSQLTTKEIGSGPIQVVSRFPNFLEAASQLGKREGNPSGHSTITTSDAEITT